MILYDITAQTEAAAAAATATTFAAIESTAVAATAAAAARQQPLYGGEIPARGRDGISNHKNCR